MLEEGHPRIIHNFYVVLSNLADLGEKVTRRTHKSIFSVLDYIIYIQFYIFAKTSAIKTHTKAPNHCSYSWTQGIGKKTILTTLFYITSYTSCAPNHCSVLCPCHKMVTVINLPASVRPKFNTSYNTAGDLMTLYHNALPNA